MTNQNSENLNDTASSAKKNSLTTGILLIGIGLGLLIFRLIDLPGLFPLFLGLILLLSGCLLRKPGLIVPGGIVSGVGLGIVAIDQQWFAAQDTPASGGVFLVAFALGWLLIPLLSRLFTHESNLWALIPGGILGVIGGLILAGESGLTILSLINNYWPLALVLVGLSLLIGSLRKAR